MSDLKIALVDLDRRTAEIVSQGEDLRREAIGGAALNLALIGQYGAGSLVFGAGPLAGTLAPASALLVASFAPGAAGAATQLPMATQAAQLPSTRHVTLLLTAGPDFRCSGIDHLVLLGAADRPALIHIDRGGVRFLEPPQAADLPSLEKALRRSSPPFRSAILTGPAADAGVSLAAASLGIKGSLDKAGLAGAMAAKNLRGILLGGSGGIGFATEDLRRSLELAEKIKSHRKKTGGFTSLVKAAGGGDCLKALKGAKLSDAACFHCPAPCMVHARFAAVDPHLPHGPKKQNGVLLMDHLGWITLARKRGEGVLPLLAETLRLGFDPSKVAAFLPAVGSPASDMDALAALARAGSDAASTSVIKMGTAPDLTLHNRELSRMIDLTFGGGLPQIGTGEEARRQTALAFVLGICPLFLLRFPQTAGDLLAFLPAGVSSASLDRAAERVLAQG
jgi:hypothetical protein